MSRSYIIRILSVLRGELAADRLLDLLRERVHATERDGRAVLAVGLDPDREVRVTRQDADRRAVLLVALLRHRDRVAELRLDLAVGLREADASDATVLHPEHHALTATTTTERRVRADVVGRLELTPGVLGRSALQRLADLRHPDGPHGADAVTRDERLADEQPGEPRVPPRVQDPELLRTVTGVDLGDEELRRTTATHHPGAVLVGRDERVADVLKRGAHLGVLLTDEGADLLRLRHLAEVGVVRIELHLPLGQTGLLGLRDHGRREDRDLHLVALVVHADRGEQTTVRVQLRELVAEAVLRVDVDRLGGQDLEDLVSTQGFSLFSFSNCVPCFNKKHDCVILVYMQKPVKWFIALYIK